MIIPGKFYEDRIGEAIQITYWDDKLSVYGILKGTNQLSFVIKPAAHMPFKRINGLPAKDTEGLRERLNTNSEINTGMKGIRDIAFFGDGGHKLLGYDIREAPNIPKLPNF